MIGPYFFPDPAARVVIATPRPTVLALLGRPWLSLLVLVGSFALAWQAAQGLKTAIEDHQAAHRAIRSTHGAEQWDLLVARLEIQVAATALGPEPVGGEIERFQRSAQSLRTAAPGALQEALHYGLPMDTPAREARAGHGTAPAMLSAGLSELKVISVAPGLLRGVPEQLGLPLPEALAGTVRDNRGGLVLLGQADPAGGAPRLVLLAIRRGPGDELLAVSAYTFDAQRLAELAVGPTAAPMLQVHAQAGAPEIQARNQLQVPLERPAAGWALSLQPSDADLPPWQAYLPWMVGVLIASLGGIGALLVRRKGEDVDFAMSFARSATQVSEFNQARLLDFIELSADWLWETDEEHRYTLVSSGILNVAQLDPQNDIAKAPWQIDFLNMDTAFWANYRAQVKRREPIQLTLSRINLEGEIRHLELRGKPMFDGERFMGYRGVGRDVTERLAAQEALRASESRFRDLVELSSDWYWEQDADFRYTALSSNPQNRRPTRFSQLLGRTRWEIAGADATDPAWSAHITTLMCHQPFSNFVYQSTWLDGQPIWFAVSGRPLFDAAGNFLGYRGVSTDITEERTAQYALTESETRYRNTFEHAPVGIATLSPGGNWQSVNDTLCEILGCRRGELVGRSYEQATHPEDQAQDRQDLQQLADGRISTASREKRFVAQDGSVVWGRVTLSAEHDNYGSTRSLICVVEDVTDRIVALHALRASEERYRRLVEMAPDGVFVQRDGIIQFANQASLRILGARSDAELVGRSLLDHVDGEYRKEEEAHFHSLAEHGGSGSVPPHQLRLRRLDGGTIEVESSAVAVELEYHPAVLCMVRDITDRLAANRALLESQSRYRDVVESVNEVIFQTDAKGRFTFLNQAWSHITGFQVADSLGRGLVDFLHPDDRARARATLEQVLARTRADSHTELRIRTRDGQIRWIEAAVRQAQGGSGLSGSLDDISTRKIAELTLKNLNQELEARVRLRTAELENSNRELEAFSYSVSHDLRAPLRAIDGFAHIIEEDYVEHIDPAGRAYLARIRTATHRMAALIDDLIELARLTRQPLRREYVDMSELVGQIVDELRAESPEREVDLQITQGLAANVDRALLRVVLENLLRNAWKFTATTPRPQVSVTAERVDGKLIYCVGDNGVGFDMAFANKLFRPFHRLHGSAEFSGSGIGLATVQRIIQRHGGSVWTEAKPGEGARFFFTLA
jgi:PAS domain S-box-containing protein